MRKGRGKQEQVGREKEKVGNCGKKWEKDKKGRGERKKVEKG